MDAQFPYKPPSSYYKPKYGKPNTIFNGVFLSYLFTYCIINC